MRGSLLHGITLKWHGKELSRDVGILRKWRGARFGLIAHVTELGECDWEAFFTAMSEMRFSPSREDSYTAACRSGPSRMWEVQG